MTLAELIKQLDEFKKWKGHGADQMQVRFDGLGDVKDIYEDSDSKGTPVLVIELKETL